MIKMGSWMWRHALICHPVVDLDLIEKLWKAEVDVKRPETPDRRYRVACFVFVGSKL